MDNELKDKSNFLENIEDLHRLHFVTIDFKHGIEHKPDTWKMFEPSKFVYAYFAFNTLYNFDWEESCQSNSLIVLKKIKIDGKDEKPNEAQKFNKMVEFVFNNLVEEDMNHFLRFILKPRKNENPKQNKDLIASINEIIPDKNISQKKSDDFKKVFAALIEKKQFHKESISIMLKFIFLVRCNIFHGTKDTINMLDKNQRNRLEIYSNILIGFNELLFKSIEKKLNVTLNKKYNLKINDRN